MKRRAAVLLFAVAAAIGLCLGPAGATGRHHHGHRVLVVDNEPRHHRSCLGTRNPLDTIQGAVDVAPSGATIWVCPGLYTETVTVRTPHLTINGANAGRDASGPGRRRESVVSHPDPDPDGTVQLLADDITWDGFTILGDAGATNGPGMTTSPGSSGYVIRDTIFRDNGVGLHLGASGDVPSFVCGNRFVDNNELEPGGGYGIFSDLGAARVLITYNRFQGHNGAGIFFADQVGAPQQDVLIDHNRSVDDRSFATIYASSRVRVTSNSVRARVGPDDNAENAASAIFIGARSDQVLVHRNRVHSASGNGIDVSPSGEPGHGKKPPTHVVVSKNKVEGAKLAGLRMAIETAGVQVTANTALGNGVWDCQDDSTGTATLGTANTWLENLGVKSSPTGLCAPPPPPTDHPGHGKGHHHKKQHHKPDPCTCQRNPKAF